MCMKPYAPNIRSLNDGQKQAETDRKLEYMRALPDPQGEYRVYADIRDKETGAKNKAMVGYSRSENNQEEWAESVNEFNRTYVTVAKTGDSTWRLSSSFDEGPEVQISWAVYDADDRNTKIDGKSYSYDNVFEYELPEAGRRYAVKAFVRNIHTSEQKSAWVAFLPLSEEPPQEPDAIPGFTWASLERNLIDGGYRFRNTFESAEIDACGFEIYARSGAELTPLQTVNGPECVFTDYDPERDYALKAFVRLADGTEKTVEFYRIFGRASQEVLAGSVPQIHTPVQDTMDGRYGEYDISLPLDWNLPGIPDRSRRNEIQSFRLLFGLIDAYRSTGKTEYAQRFCDYMESWLDGYPDVPVEEDSELWNDFSVSRRTQVFSIARIVLDQMIDNELLQKMEDHLAQCAQILSSEYYYKSKHNHGMYQDLGLLLYLDAFGYQVGNEASLRELAIERLWAYFDFSILDSGCHTEHSPAYHNDIMTTVNWCAEYFALYDDPAVDEFMRIRQNMEKFYFDLVMPDFTWPALGDSYSTILEQPYLEDDPRYKWIISRGSEGAPPSKSFIVYDDGGYAIMRSAWEDAPEEATYCLLTAATHSAAHKHQDDLNFILYHKGQLFTEAGKRNYTYDDPMTIYAYSSYAHNVLFVDNQGWPMSETNHPVLDDAAYQTKITAYGQDDDVMWATASSIRWPEVAQERTLRYDRGNSTAEVADRLTAEGSTNVRLIYHIAEGVEISDIENGWLLTRDSVPVAQVIVKATQEVALSALRGEQEEGEFKTWLFDRDHLDTPIYGGLLMVDMVCEAGENEVALEIELY